MKVLILLSALGLVACMPNTSSNGGQDGSSMPSQTADPDAAGSTPDASGRSAMSGRTGGETLAAGTTAGRAGVRMPMGGERDSTMNGGGSPSGSSGGDSRNGEIMMQAGERDLSIAGREIAGRPMPTAGVDGGGVFENADTGGRVNSGAGFIAGMSGLAGMSTSDIAMAGAPDTAGGLAEILAGEVQQNQAGMDVAGGAAQPCSAEPQAIRPTVESIPRVMVAVDRSWSMLQNEDRWTPVVTTITRVTAALTDQVKFGLLLFPNANRDAPPDNDQLGACLASGRDQFDCVESSQACLPGIVNVEPTLNNADVVRQALMGNRPVPNSGTPTASALHAAQEFLRAEPTGRDVVVLATDGGPGCNFGLNAERCICMSTSCSLFGSSEMCLDDTSTLGRVRAMAEQNIQTLVLGISIGLPEENECVAERCFADGQVCVDGQCLNQTPPLLDAMAVAGGLDVDGRHYQVNQLQNIDGQLSRALGRLVSCRYGLNDAVPPLNRLGVRIDGIQIVRDGARSNGWDMDGGDIVFYGDACERLRDGQAHEVQVTCVP